MVAVCKSDTQSRVNARYNKSSNNTPIYYAYQTQICKCFGFAVRTGSSIDPFILIHSYMDRNEHLEVYHRGPTFLGQFVTKPVVTQGTNRCQMKDMNKIFPEIPYGLL